MKDQQTLITPLNGINMKSFFSCKTLISTSLALTTLLNIQANASETKQLTTIVDAKPVERIAPKYPINAARMRREGWAKLSYVIEKDGSVSNILVEDVSGYKGFGKASVKAMEQWKFKPAFENGKAVQQCQNSVQMDFAMDYGKKNSLAVSRDFLRLYNNALDALKAKDFPLVEEKIEKIEKIKVWKRANAVYTYLIKAEYAKALGNAKKELEYLQKSTSFTSLPKEMYFSILQQQYLLNIKLNNIVSAYDTLNKIMAMDEAKSNMSIFQDHKKKLDDFIAKGTDIVVNGQLLEPYTWHHKLLRNSFSLLANKGALQEVDVRCANKRHVFSIGENSTWTIPEKWQRCSVYIKGDKEATFKLVEHAKPKLQANTAA